MGLLFAYVYKLYIFPVGLDFSIPGRYTGKSEVNRMNRKHNRIQSSIPRLIFVGISLLIQLGWLLVLILRLNEYSALISLITGLLALLVVLRLYSGPANAAMKLPWIMLILTMPVMGLSLYLLMEVFGDLGSTGKKLKASRDNCRRALTQEEAVSQALSRQDPAVANISRYLLEHCEAPAFGNTQVRYFDYGAHGLEAMKEDLEKAESFVFMEYFIVAQGTAFEELKDILIRKARQGVEVRLMYDDIGSVGYVNLLFAKELNDAGIRCQVFNPALPILNLFMNHRDHRKITVIDGKVGYTGGYNLSDEYFGREFPFGQWKDTGIRMEGDAVRSLTAAYLELWSIMSRKEENTKAYLSVCHRVEARGFVQPYFDDPLGKERVAENVYLNLCACARKSLYFFTPYLIITDELRSALTLASKRGVDVRIITPGIPDKKTVYAVTRSYYAGLASEGVRIYEWSPGFCHAKQCICDGVVASIGTSNLDFRSLYHHFENNVLLWECPAVEQIARDFEETFPQCREVTEHYRTGRAAMLRIWQCILRLFSPLL